MSLLPLFFGAFVRAKGSKFRALMEEANDEDWPPPLPPPEKLPVGGHLGSDAAPEPPPPFDPAKAVGVTAPLGYFDPLGFCQVGDYEGFHKLRSSELKHGRVAMMAAAGTVFAHFVKLPGFESTPAGLGALTDPIGVLGFTCLLLPVALAVETVYWRDDDLSKEPGNFGDPGDWAGLFGAFGGGYSDEIRNKEINNGRMAMISIWGILGAEIATGKDGIQQFGIDAAPVAAELTVAAGSAAPVAAAMSSAAPVPAGLVLRRRGARRGHRRGHRRRRHWAEASAPGRRGR